MNGILSEINNKQAFPDPWSWSLALNQFQTDCAWVWVQIHFNFSSQKLCNSGAVKWKTSEWKWAEDGSGRKTIQQLNI